MSDDRDPLIDACLDEILGGQKPPDLTHRILRADKERHRVKQPIAAGGALEASGGEDLLPAIISPVDPAAALRNANSPNRRRATKEWRITAGAVAALGLSLVALVLVIGEFQQPRKQLSDARPGSVPADNSNHQRTDHEVRQSTPPKPVTRGMDSEPRTVRTEAGSSGHDAPAGGKSPAERPSAVGVVEPARATTPYAAPGNAVENVSDVPAPMDDNKVVARINALVEANWAERGAKPAPRVANEEWLQRAFRVAFGREPTGDELAELMVNGMEPGSTLKSLLGAETIPDEFAQRWGEFWASVFLDSEDNVSVASRAGLVTYFRQGFLAKESLENLVIELLTASGSVVAEDENFNGAVSFLLAHDSSDQVRTTGDVARLFLGRSIECQQCHDDPRFGGGSQEQYWAFNSFFRQLAIVRDSSRNPVGIRDADIAGDKRQLGSAAVYYTTGSGLMKAAFPVFFDGTAIAPQGAVAQVNRRQELARLVKTDQSFRRNLANRVWAEVMGRGWVTLEQVVRNNSLEHPEPLVFLADQFAAHDYDLRQLLTWCMLSEPFHLQQSTDGLNSLVASGTPSFDRYYGSLPRQPQVRASDRLAVALREFGAEPSVAAATTAKVAPSAKSLDSPSSTLIEVLPTATPRGAASEVAADPTVTMILNSQLTAKQKAEHLFQLARHREPRGREVSMMDELLEKSGENKEAALRAIWWALRIE